MLLTKKKIKKNQYIISINTSFLSKIKAQTLYHIFVLLPQNKVKGNFSLQSKHICGSNLSISQNFWRNSFLDFFSNVITKITGNMMYYMMLSKIVKNRIFISSTSSGTYCLNPIPKQIFKEWNTLMRLF